MPETNTTQLTWYGQSAFKITTPTGKVLLIDPWITNPLNENAKTDLANLNKVDLIFITHGHGDHVGDAVEIGRESRYDLYDLLIDLPRPLVPRYLRFDVPHELVTNVYEMRNGRSLQSANCLP